MKKRKKIKAGDIAGEIGPGGYRWIEVDGVYYTAQDLAWLTVTGEWPKGLLVHINGNKDDNRLVNLRLVTEAEIQIGDGSPQ